MVKVRSFRLAGSIYLLMGTLAPFGCYSTPVDTSEFAQGPAPLHNPSPDKEADS